MSISRGQIRRSQGLPIQITHKKKSSDTIANRTQRVVRTRESRALRSERKRFIP